MKNIRKKRVMPADVKINPSRQRTRKRILYFSLVIFPVTFYYFSPVVTIMGAVRGIVTGSMIMFFIQFLTAVFFGRAFCGWLCPAGAIQEVCSSVRKRKIHPGRGDLVKYFIVWMPWLAAIVILFARSGGIAEVNPLFMTANGVSVGDIPGLIAFLSVVSVFVLMSLIFGRRASCHYICWMAPFMVLGTRLRNALNLPGLRLVTSPGQCINCGACSENCTMSIEVQQLVQNKQISHCECIMCGSCADVCPGEVISYAVKQGDEGSRPVTGSYV